MLEALTPGFEALADAGVKNVDLITIGCMSPGLFVGQEHLASLLADEIGMAGTAASRVESACASVGFTCVHAGQGCAIA